MRFAGCVLCPLLMSAGLTACQLKDQAVPPVAERHQPDLATIDMAAAAAGPDWDRAENCRDKLTLLQQGLSDGSLVDLDGTPFALIDHGVSSGRFSWSRATGLVDPALEAASPSADVRCVIRISRAVDQRSEHRMLAREQVRSRYQSGTRTEKNPDYDVAKARLRRAEKAAKPGKSSIVSVGDPLIDLVGTLIGGALTGFEQWGAGDELEEALDELMATSPSIDHPVYKGYSFERSRVRASREATLPILLTDRRLQQSWQTSLKRREMRELFVIDGLDRQDENYAAHRENGLTKDGFRQWLDEAPAVPLIDIAAGLLDRPAVAPFDRLALSGDSRVAEDSAAAPNGLAIADQVSFVEGSSFDAAALPADGLFGVGRDVFAPPTSKQGGERRLADVGLVKVMGEREAMGVFVTSDFILTSSDAIGDAGLVDIEGAPGHAALGLVAAIDHGLGLALVQSPTSGELVSIGNALPADWSPSSRSGDNAPLLAHGQLVGFKTSSGPDIDISAIRLFLDHQQHILSPPTGHSCIACDQEASSASIARTFAAKRRGRR